MNDEFGIDEQFDMLGGDGDSGYDYQIPKNIYYLINPADIPDDVREEALKFISENTFTANLKFNEDYDNEAGFLDLKITKTSNKLNFEYALFVIVLSYICKLMQTRNFKNDQVVLSEYEKLFDKVDYYLENFEELIKKETLNSRPFNNKRIEFNIEGNNFVTYTLNLKKYFLGGLCTNSMEKSFECLYILLKYYHEKFVNYYKLDEFYKTINLAFKTIRAMNLDISDTDTLRIIPACFAYFMTKHIEFVKERDNIGDDLSVDISNNVEIDSSWNVSFDTMPISKLIILSLFTFGIYEYVWMYHNWRRLKRGRLWAFLLTMIAGNFTIFILFSEINKELKKKNKDFKIEVGAFGLIFFVTRIFETPMYGIPVLSLIPLCIVQSKINSFNKEKGLTSRFNKWNALNVIWLSLVVVFWLVVFIVSILPIET